MIGTGSHDISEWLRGLWSRHRKRFPQLLRGPAIFDLFLRRGLRTHDPKRMAR